MIGAKETCKFQVHVSIVRAKRKRVNLTIVPVPALPKESTIGLILVKDNPNLNGLRVSLGEIEAILKQQPDLPSSRVRASSWIRPPRTRIECRQALSAIYR